VSRKLLKPLDFRFSNKSPFVLVTLNHAIETRMPYQIVMKFTSGRTKKYMAMIMRLNSHQSTIFLLNLYQSTCEVEGR
jgi:hypothetical protein